MYGTRIKNAFFVLFLTLGFFGCSDNGWEYYELDDFSLEENTYGKAKSGDANGSGLLGPLPGGRFAPGTPPPLPLPIPTSLPLPSDPVLVPVALPVAVAVDNSEIVGDQCVEDKDCRSNNPCIDFTCSAGKCIGHPVPDCLFCEQDEDCPSGEICVDGQCEPEAFSIGGTISGLTSSGLILRNNGGNNLSIPANAATFQFSTLIPEGGSYNVTIFQQPSGLSCTVSNGSGTNVTADVTNVIIMCSASPTFTIGGSINGLTASGLILQNNGGDNLTIAANATSFQFATPIAEGGSYAVTIFQQPSGLTCTLSNASGTNVMANVSNVIVTCSASPAFTIGGTITGLTTTGLILQNNGGDNLNVPVNATSFQFSTSIAEGGSYAVTILQQPSGLTCSLSNATGTNVMANVTNITVACSASESFTIGGSVIGLTSNELVLQNNGTDNLDVPAAATSFAFATPIAAGGSYSVTVHVQPSGLTCTVSNASGSNVMANITNVTVTCISMESFVIGGEVSGLTSSGLILQNNGSDNLSVAANVTIFQFPNPVPAGGSYAVTVLQQPLGLTCTVTNAFGTDLMDDVTDVMVTCSGPTSFTIGGAVAGLTNSGLILQNNGGDNLSVAANATSFQFPTSVASGGSYAVTIFQQPSGLTCTLSNASGTNVTANVTNVILICS